MLDRLAQRFDPAIGANDLLEATLLAGNLADALDPVEQDPPSRWCGDSPLSPVFIQHPAIRAPFDSTSNTLTI